MRPILGEIIGWELLLVVGIIALLFGSSQIPKLARSLGEASREFRRGTGEAEDRSPGSDADPKDARS